MFKGIIFFIIAWLFVLLGLYGGGILQSTTEPISGILVTGGVIVLLYIAFSLGDIGEAVGFVFSRDREIARGKYLKLSHVYSAVGDYSLYCGVLATIIGFVLMLQTMEDPSTIGPKLSVAFLTLLYGIVGKLLAVLAQRKLELCAVTEESYELKPRKQLGSFLIGVILVILVVMFGIKQQSTLISFIDPGSLFIVIGGSVFVALLFVPGADIIDSFKSAFSSGEVTAGGAKKALGVFTQLNDVVVSLAIFAAVAGWISLLRTMGDPSTFGPKMALILLSIFYGIMLICFIRGLFYMVQRRLAGLNEQIDEKPVFTANALILLGLSPFVVFVILFAFSFFKV